MSSHLTRAVPVIVWFVMLTYSYMLLFFFFNDTATTEIYTLSLHDALPISSGRLALPSTLWTPRRGDDGVGWCLRGGAGTTRSEEHTSELQSRLHLVCRLLLEKKKIYMTFNALSGA